MIWTLSFNLIERLGLIVIIAFFISKTVVFKNYVVKSKSTLWENLFFALLWGGLGILMTLLGTPVRGGIANSRTIPVVLAGLFGGPVVGAISGGIAGFHRAFLTHGGELTAISCGISTFLGGVMGGYCKRYLDLKKSKYLYGFMLGLAVEVLQMGIILLLARPFDQALELVKIIFAPMTLLNAIGIGMFLLIVEQIYEEHEKAAAFKAQMALKIANETLPYLKQGLTESSAQKAARVIYEVTGYDAVSITNCETVLSHVGLGSDHHVSGGMIKTRITKEVIKNGTMSICQRKQEIGCEDLECTLKSVAVIPLHLNNQIIGTLKVYKDKEQAITKSDLELVKGLGNLFTTQLELSNIELEKSLREEAELKALRAQIKPHFLFNVLNTIMSMIRTDAEEARKLLQELSVFLRTSFKNSDPLVPLAEEIRFIEAFLRIEKARFPDKLRVRLEVDHDLECSIPPLIIQPLVENAVKHGIRHKSGPGTVALTIHKGSKGIEVKVEDDGVGMNLKQINELDLSEGVGLGNVRQRLKTIYNQDLRIQSSLNEGTKITFTIPLKGVNHA